MGSIFENTSSGSLYLVEIDTLCGLLRLLKVRRPDDSHSERGDADFTIVDFEDFKKRVLIKSGFYLIKRPGSRW